MEVEVGVYSVIYGSYIQTMIYVISMDYFLLRHRRLSWQNVPSGNEWGEIWLVLQAVVFSSCNEC